ncbi:MAG: hypothetical protein WKF30_18940 [Pyrinomonadaceae bacterium]
MSRNIPIRSASKARRRKRESASASRCKPPVDPALKTSFLILLIAVGLEALIACANVANLLLARAMTRQRSLPCGRRSALPGCLLRQIINESLLLATFSGALSLLVAH